MLCRLFTISTHSITTSHAKSFFFCSTHKFDYNRSRTGLVVFFFSFLLLFVVLWAKRKSEAQERRPSRPQKNNKKRNHSLTPKPSCFVCSVSYLDIITMMTTTSRPAGPEPALAARRGHTIPRVTAPQSPSLCSPGRLRCRW